MVARWQHLKARLAAMMSAYGPVALGTWFAIFFATWASLFAALSAGVDLSAWFGPLDGAGTVFIAYAATQLTKPARVVATLALTPLVAARLGIEPAADEPAPAAPEDATADRS